MKNKFSVLVAVPALILAFSAQAHDEKEHMKTAESPDCAAMSGMDHSKMDMSAPVVMAMMTQCMSTMKHGSEESDVTPHAHRDHMTGAGKVGDHMLAPSQ
jgi:hypothetical protein